MDTPNPAASRPASAPFPDNEFAWREHMQRWGAISYSPTTRRYGCSHGWRYQADAENRALAECGAPDAFIAVSARDHIYLVLALAGNGSWGWGANADQNTAQQVALSNCADAGRRIVVVVHPVMGVISLA